MRAFLLILGLAVSTASEAQFRLPNFDINKMVDTVKNVGRAVKEIGEPEEIEIGRDVASRLLGAAPLVADPGMQRYVNHVGRWLAAQSERPDLPWQFGVLESPNVNAFAVPGGTAKACVSIRFPWVAMTTRSLQPPPSMRINQGDNFTGHAGSRDAHYGNRAGSRSIGCLRRQGYRRSAGHAGARSHRAEGDRRRNHHRSTRP